MINGGGAAPYAPKTPLEEALKYARDNCQSCNVQAPKEVYKRVIKYVI